jgi:hypothetical protein
MLVVQVMQQLGAPLLPQSQLLVQRLLHHVQCLVEARVVLVQLHRQLVLVLQGAPSATGAAAPLQQQTQVAQQHQVASCML